MRKDQYLKVKNSLSNLDFIESKDRELKGRKVKIKSDIEELFFKSFITSTDDMDKFKQKKRRKKKGKLKILGMIG